MESLISQALALALLFLLIGGGFLVSIVVLGIASRITNLKTRGGLVAISIFVLATQVTCMERASNFGGNNESAYSNPIYGWLFIIICLWSIYLIRNTSVMIHLRRGLLWIYGHIIIMIKNIYKNTGILIHKLNKKNNKIELTLIM